MSEHPLDVIFVYSEGITQHEMIFYVGIMEFIDKEFPEISTDEANRIAEETIRDIREKLNRLQEIPTALQDGAEES